MANSQDGPCPCDLLQGVVAETRSLVCAGLDVLEWKAFLVVYCPVNVRWLVHFPNFILRGKNGSMVLLTRVVVTTLVTSQIGKETSVYIDFLIKRGRCYSIYLRYVQD